MTQKIVKLVDSRGNLAVAALNSHLNQLTGVLAVILQSFLLAAISFIMLLLTHSLCALVSCFSRVLPCAISRAS